MAGHRLPTNGGTAMPVNSFTMAWKLEVLVVATPTPASSPFRVWGLYETFKEVQKP